MMTASGNSRKHEPCDHPHEGHHRHDHTPGAHTLNLQAIGASYGDKCALKGVTFQVCCGHRLAVLGPNGAGKSTLLRLLAGLKKPDSGAIQWRGKTLNSSVREIAYLPQINQHQRLFPATIRDVVAMGRFPDVGIWRKFTGEDDAIIDEAMEIMDLSDLGNRQIDQLSGGQQQRAFIARALAQEAHVILLDEPFSGLDVEASLHLTRTIDTLSKRGHLIIASHHNLATVEQIFDQALVLNQSQIAFGITQEVMRQPEVAHVFECQHYSSNSPQSNTTMDGCATQID